MTDKKGSNKPSQPVKTGNNNGGTKGQGTNPSNRGVQGNNHTTTGSTGPKIPTNKK